jgi:Ankyrin repeats (many copies)
MSSVPPPWDPSGDADEQYRRASDLDASRPSEAMRRAVLSHAERLAAGRARRTAGRRWMSPPGAMLRWQPAIVGTVAAALLIAVLIAPQFLMPRAPQNSTSESFRDAAPVPRPATAPPPARPPAPPSTLQRARIPSDNSPRAPRQAPLNEPRADMNAAAGVAAGAATARAVQAPRPSAPEAQTLRRAAAAGDLTALGAQLAGGAQIDARDEQGRTALMLAIVNGRADAVELLLARGADPNAADAQGISPLQAAERSGMPRISSALRRHGAR